MTSLRISSSLLTCAREVQRRFPDLLRDVLRADNRGHDDDHVAEVDLVALTVGETTGIQSLERTFRKRTKLLLKEVIRVEPVNAQTP
jgi:hypothetical protein